ncbi:MAG: pyridoxamine 5'-phosphate oxidase family protein [Gemmatimonadetes bacterium]|nr:pyridoxamine 5'-phosphate oxidase family protein [Gemmatimonadota bacterium]
MPIQDEPVIGREIDDAATERTPEPLESRVRHLMTTQPYGVLCTHGEGHAYGSLVAFAASEDLTEGVFATPVATRKYKLLSEHEGVALVVDNRPDFPHDTMRVAAITATGAAREVRSEAERRRWATLLVQRHPSLEAFVAAESCALFKIEFARYLFVTRFQEVEQWIPRAE